MIDNLKVNFLHVLLRRDFDLTFRRFVAQRIIDNVADRLSQQSIIAQYQRQIICKRRF